MEQTIEQTADQAVAASAPVATPAPTPNPCEYRRMALRTLRGAVTSYLGREADDLLREQAIAALKGAGITAKRIEAEYRPTGDCWGPMPYMKEGFGIVAFPDGFREPVFVSKGTGYRQ